MLAAPRGRADNAAMPDDDPPAAAPVFAPRTAFALGAALLLGLIAVAVFARVDRERVGALEQFSETTAVGDKVYFHLPPEPRPAPPERVALLRGEALIPISYDKFEARDTTMRPVARDPATQLTIYALREPAPGEPVRFVKTAANEYLRLRVER